ncbi:MAG: hypothetical protein AAF358_06090 [Pseudomonadota bacterium]
MLKNTMKTLAAASLLASGASFGADLMVTPFAAGNQTQLRFEFVNDESAVTALEFDIKLEGMGSAKIETGNCTAGIFTNHSGSCAYNAERKTLTVLVFSPANEVLPTFELGSVTLGVAPQQLGSLKVQNLVMADTNGKAVEGGTLMLDKSLLRDALSDEKLDQFSAK